MQTETLVASLADNLRAVPRGAIPRRLSLGLAGGGVVTMILVVSSLGLRPDLADAMLGFPFWMKWSYTISVGVVAVLAAIHLARPEADRPHGLWWLVLPVALLAALAGRQLATTAPGDWTALWQGQSWRICTIKVATLSLPIFTGLLIAFRSFAPTRLRLTGAVAGLAAGAGAATLYGLHCPEVSALFILIWYSLGMLAAAAIGALTGPTLLRW
jgi:hypothetical protein